MPAICPYCEGETSSKDYWRNNCRKPMMPQPDGEVPTYDGELRESFEHAVGLKEAKQHRGVSNGNPTELARDSKSSQDHHANARKFGLCPIDACATSGTARA